MPTETMEAPVTVETPPTSEVTTTSTDDPRRAIFDKVMANQSPVAESAAEDTAKAEIVDDRPRNEKGQFAKVEDKTDEVEKQSEQSGESTETQEAADDKESQQDEPELVKISDLSDKSKKLAQTLGVEDEQQAFDRAFAAYKRDPAFDEADIEELWSKDQKRFIEKGLSLAKYQADGDEFSAKHKELLKQVASGQQPAQSEGRDGQQPPKPVHEEIKQEIQKIVDSIPTQDEDGTTAFINGEGMRDILGKGFTTLAEKMASHNAAELARITETYQSELKKGEEVNQLLGSRLVDMQLDLERTRLISKYDKLADDAVNEEVLKVYDKLAASDEYNDPAEAYRLATIRVLGEQKENDFKARLLRQSKAKKAIAPHKPTPAPKNGDELADRRKAFDLAMRKNGM